MHLVGGALIRAKPCFSNCDIMESIHNTKATLCQEKKRHIFCDTFFQLLPEIVALYTKSDICLRSGPESPVVKLAKPPHR